MPLLFGFVLALLEENTWASSVEPRISISATSTCPHPVRARSAIAVDTAGVNYLDIYQRNGAARAPFVAGVKAVAGG